MCRPRCFNLRLAGLPDLSMTARGTQQSCQIAVIGIEALFPGDPGTRGFWKTIFEGRDCIADVPPGHWLIEDYFDPDLSRPGKTCARRGAFLSPVNFDPIAHGIPPSMLASTDTAQLLSLVVARRLLESCSRAQVEKDRIAVVLGVASATELVSTMSGSLQRPVVEKVLRAAGMSEEEVRTIGDRFSGCYADWTESTFPGLLGNVVAGRIANRFDLGGMNCVVDAACASSLAAVKMAVDQLRTESADLVITGGVDAINDIFMYMCFSRTLAMSRTGDCRPFSKDADGTMLGEGIGMFALRRLEDAERDGDPVYAVIRGIGASSDGRAKSIYAPRPEGQAKALKRAYQAAGYSPASVGLMEAHGTGTVAGDEAEISALRQIFEESCESEGPWCALGSIKSQIGHTKAAAGAASLYKAVMALHHKVLPPTLKVGEPSAGLALPDGPFYLNTETRPWVHGVPSPRRASVSSFGFGGSNFHLTLEEYRGPAPVPSRIRTLRTELFLFSADDPAGLIVAARNFAQSAARPEAFAPAARESQRAFNPGQSHRLAVVAAGAVDLAGKVDLAARTVESGSVAPPGFAYGTGPRIPGKIAFLFPGQGSQYLGMTSGLALAFGEVVDAWSGSPDIAAVVFPPPATAAEQKTAQSERLTDTRIAQTAISIASTICLDLLLESGLKPDMSAGHSFGEFTALHCAGVLSRAGLQRVARERGRVMADAARRLPGAMAAVSLSSGEIEREMASLGGDLVIANFNSRNQVVLSGPADQIAAAVKHLNSRGAVSRVLDVSTAFHSRLVEPAVAEFASFLKNVEFSSPSIPIYSNTTGGVYPCAPETARELAGNQLARPVRFADVVAAMYAAGARIFVEVGPSSVLTNLVTACLGDSPHMAVATDTKGQDSVTALWSAFAKLAAAGIPVDLEFAWREYAEPAGEPASESSATVSISGTNFGKKYPAAIQPFDLPGRPVPSAQPARSEGQTVEGERAAAIRLIQENMAGAHAAAQRALAESHLAYLKASELALHAALGHSVGFSPEPLPASLPPNKTAVSYPISPAPAEPAFPPNLTVPPPVKPAPPPNLTILATGSEEMVLSVIADETGYPVDILTPDMDLEADLGIDSIKRVQILASLARKQPGLPEIDPSAMAAIRTIGSVIAYWKSAATPKFRANGHAPVPLTVSGEEVNGFNATARDPLPNHAPPNRGTGHDLQDLVLAVIAEETGYPPDILTPDMDLEADLGIDSIKRVQIFASVAKKQPDLPEFDSAAMAAIRTIGSIVAYLNGSPPEPVEPVKHQQPAKVDTGVKRLLVREVWGQDSSVEPLFVRGDSIAVIGGGEAGKLLADALKRDGANVRESDLVSQEIRVAVFLDLEASADSGSLAERAFSIARDFTNSRGIEGGALVLVTARASGRRSQQAALAKTLALEHPGCSVRVVEIDSSGLTAHEIAGIVHGVLRRPGTEPVLVVDEAGRRKALQEVEMPVAGGLGLGVLRDRPVVVASGGGRGITSACLLAAAKVAPMRIALLGRTTLEPEPADLAHVSDGELKPALLAAARSRNESLKPKELDAAARRITACREVNRTMESLRALGSDVLYLSADMTDSRAVDEAVTQVRRRWGQIDILIHGAGIIADKRIAVKTAEQFRRVFGTKVLGFDSLLKTTSEDKLRFIAAFSSVAARYGNVGQSDYAMANAALNQMAMAESERRGPECAVRSINWGPWAGGMVTPELHDRFRHNGVPVLSMEDGSNAFVRELQHGTTDNSHVDVVICAS